MGSRRHSALGDDLVTGAVGVDGSPGDRPDAYIARDLRAALARGEGLPDRVDGAAIFADISGFTPLTEALRAELGPRRGAEELSANLDRVFHAVISQLDRFDGNVIYFAGDAITGWVDGDDGRRAVASALAMQAAMAREGQITTPRGTTVQLALKVAVAVGSARRFVVGDPDIQRIDVLAGRLLDELAAAEQHASKGEVVITARAAASLGDRVVLSAARGTEVRVVERLTIEVPDAPAEQPPALDAAIVRQWLLPAVYERITTGRGEFLGELRSACPLFLRFAGIDFDADEHAIDKLDDFVVRAQRVFASYGGNLLQLSLGDKGAYVYGVFGSPIAHEDDAARAAAAALELRALDGECAARDIQIGIAHGTLRSGTYGHAMRRTFVCLGDAVNLSARLMSAAPAGDIYVAAELCRLAGENFVWDELDALSLKGKAAPVKASRLSGSLTQASRRHLRYELPMVGRQAELDALNAALDATCGGSGQVIGISAEAGMGKSRLVAEFVRAARRSAFRVVFGECQAYGSSSSYQVWREIWQRLLNVEDGQPPDQQRDAAVHCLHRIDPSLVPRAPLLAEVLGLSIADTELTASFDAKLRKSSLEDLLARCLRDCAAGEPLVVVLEDIHWIDDLSRDLLQALVRAAVDDRVMFVLAYRPGTAAEDNSTLARLANFCELDLGDLDPVAMNALLVAKSIRVLDRPDPPEALLRLIVGRAQGNPFYAEELLNYVADRGIAIDETSALDSLDLPESLNSLVLSRIDGLGEEFRRTLKVASVYGRVFRAPQLPGAYPELGSPERVDSHLQALVEADLLRPEEIEVQAYLFRHVVTRDVAYNSMPFSIRTELHRRIGEYIEECESADLEPHLDVLAHHFWNGDDDDKKRIYLMRAEESARARYANTAAIDYGERLLTLTTGAQRAEVLLRLGEVIELSGDWARAESVHHEAAAIASGIANAELVARCAVALAEVARKQGRYRDAGAHLDEAAATFTARGDEAGLGRVFHLSGSVAAQQGDYADAREAYQASLAIRERIGDRAGVAALHSNLAIIAEYQGDFDSARRENETALEIRAALGDRWAIGVSHNNLGMIALHQQAWAEAQDRFEQAMRLNLQVGDTWMVSICHNNLGNARRGQGDLDGAREAYARGLLAHRGSDDDWGLCFLLEDVAVLAALATESGLSLELAGAADALRDAIGSPRGPSQDAEFNAGLAAAMEGPGDRAASIRDRGRTLDTTAALELALGYCNVTNIPTE